MLQLTGERPEQHIKSRVAPSQCVGKLIYSIAEVQSCQCKIKKKLTPTHSKWVMLSHSKLLHFQWFSTYKRTLLTFSLDSVPAENIVTMHRNNSFR